MVARFEKFNTPNSSDNPRLEAIRRERDEMLAWLAEHPEEMNDSKGVVEKRDTFLRRMLVLDDQEEVIKNN